MTIRAVLKMGDPRLLERSRAVERFGTPELLALIADMRDTMAALSGAGLAAPQIGVLQRVVIFGMSANPRYPDAEELPQTVLINPTLEALEPGEMEEDWEGCLSVPGMRGLVPRYRDSADRSVAGFHARVVQHEVDHLDGVLYPTRIRDLKNFGFTAELFPGAEIADD